MIPDISMVFNFLWNFLDIRHDERDSLNARVLPIIDLYYELILHISTPQ